MEKPAIVAAVAGRNQGEAGDGCRDDRTTRADPPLGQQGAQPVEGALCPLFAGLHAAARGAGNIAEIPLLEVAQEHHLAVFGRKFCHGFVQ